MNKSQGHYSQNSQGLEETPTLAIINYGTGKCLKIANGRVVTIPNTSDSHDSYRMVDAGEADQTLNTLLNGSSAEAIPSSDGNPMPIPRWRFTPKVDNSEVFYIADPQSGTWLKDAGPRTEIAEISTDAFPIGSEHDSIYLWQLVALVAADNLTSVDHTTNFARPAMELLLSQWEDKNIVYTPKKPVATVASIDKNGIKTLKDQGNKIKSNDEKALLNGGVRIDRQGLLPEKARQGLALLRQLARSSV